MRRLLLDFGGVVIKTPFELLHRVGSPDWRGPFDPAGDPLWSDLQAGVISEREHWHTRASEVYPDSEDPVRDLMRTLYRPPSIEVVRAGVLDLAVEVGAGVLTNDLARFHDERWLAEMGLEGVFKPLIDLSYVGFLKPEHRAFRHALAELEEPPLNVVFVDDQPHNVDGAKACDLVGVWFDATDPAGSIERIRQAL